MALCEKMCSVFSLQAMGQKKQNQEEEEELKGMKRQEIYSVSKLEIISDKEMKTRADP